MRTRSGLVLGALSAGMFLVLLDVTIVNVALPSIGGSLGASLPTLQWVVDGYTIPLAALLLPSGSVADRFGRRRILLAGLVLFGTGSLGCALAAGPAGLVAARAFQGVGAAVLLPASMASITTAFPRPDEQARALGIWAGAASTALPAGPVLGGALVEAFGWRAVFWLNVPVVALTAYAVLRLVSPDQPSVRRSAAGIDLAGGVTAAVALGAAVFAVIESGRDGHRSWIAVAAVVAVLALVGFGWQEVRTADPILPPALLRSGRFVAANVVAGAMNFVGIGSILVITLLLQSVRGWSSLHSGLALLPLFAPLVVLSPVTGRLVSRFGARPVMVAGLLLGAVGSGALVVIPAGGGLPPLLPSLLGLGTGMGLLTAAVVTAAIQAVPPERSGLASGVTNAARQAGGSAGVAVYGALAGSPAEPAHFVSGLHHAGTLGALLWLAAAGLTLVGVTPARSSPPARTAGR